MSKEHFEKQYELPVFAPEFFRKVNTLAKEETVYFYRPPGAVNGREERFATTLWGIVWRVGRFQAQTSQGHWDIKSNADFVVVRDGEEIRVEVL